MTDKEREKALVADWRALVRIFMRPENEAAKATLLKYMNQILFELYDFLQKNVGITEEKDLKVYVFAEDVAASGGYMLACAGDEIYADESSIVGSIGVIAAAFGFPGLMEKIGVERRVYTAGKNKDTLDPFLPEKAADVKRIKAIQLDIHEAFIDLVKSRRGDKLDKADIELFTGEFWGGKKALELGLIDGISDVRTKMREVFGENVRFKLVAPSTSWLRRKRSVSFGTGGFDFRLWPEGLTADVLSTIEARALWSRFGL